jgi:opacity protein-like surface antigen
MSVRPRTDRNRADRCRRGAALLLITSLAAAATAASAAAQTTPMPAAVVSEEIEPRIVGRRGTMSVGISGFADKFSSTENVFTTNYVAQIDVCRFLTRRFAVRGGVVGSGRFGGDDSDDESLPAGSGAPSMQAAGGVLFYFTPQKLASFYLGGEYWAQITQRVAGDTGSLVGVAGVHATLSSRASLFVQGGVGGRVARGDEGELLTRVVAQLGVRIKL